MSRPKKPPTPMDPETAAKELVKKKRPAVSERYQIHTAPGDNTKYLSHSLTMFKWQKPDMTSVPAVEERMYEYFQLCADNDMKPSFAGLALAFGVERMALWRWINGQDSKFMPDEVRKTLKRAYQILNSQMEDYMQNGKINPVSGIFLMKNNMGYEDKTEMVLAPKNPLGEQENPDVIAAKYQELPEE